MSRPAQPSSRRAPAVGLPLPAPIALAALTALSLLAVLPLGSVLSPRGAPGLQAQGQHAPDEHAPDEHAPDEHAQDQPAYRGSPDELVALFRE